MAGVIGGDWGAAAAALTGFGGEAVQLWVQKTGLPFFDALRLYGAIDLYIGVRDDVTVNDRGIGWTVRGRCRPDPRATKDLAAFRSVWKHKQPLAVEYCRELRETVLGQGILTRSYVTDGKGEWDPSLQTGVRGTSAHSYETLQSGQTSRRQCKALVELSDGILAHAGMKRIESVGDVTFLPLFEGPIDLSKVVSPLRARVGVPNILCAQALVLLMLKATLFAEGYQDRLHAVAFKTSLGGNRSDNHSGMVSIRTTAIGRRGQRPGYVRSLQQALLALVRLGWERRGRDYRTTSYTQHAMAMGSWVLQPNRQYLSRMIGSQERLRAQGQSHIFVEAADVSETFEMSYSGWSGDAKAVQSFAKAVASAIYYSRMADKTSVEERNKAWYDEVTMLRSAPSARAFFERALVLIEQGHRDNSDVGTVHRGEDFDPASLVQSAGLRDRAGFETFRDLFRMYLIHESTPRDVSARAAGREDTTKDESGEEAAQ